MTSTTYTPTSSSSQLLAQSRYLRVDLLFQVFRQSQSSVELIDLLLGGPLKFLIILGLKDSTILDPSQPS